MMNRLMFLLILGLFAAPAGAVVDPDDDMMGFYFDAAADNFCLETSAMQTVSVHLMLTNPTMNSIRGYEFGFEVSGNQMVSGVQLAGSSPIDVGGGVGNHIVGLGTPLATSEATIISTLQVFVLDTEPISFVLTAADPPSIPEEPELPVLLLSDNSLLNAGLSDNFGDVSAMINGRCQRQVEAESWGGVKTLYR